MEQKLLTIPEHQRYYSGTPTLLFRNTNVQPRVVLCPPLFLIFYLAIICSVRLRILASDYPFGTFKRFPHRKDARFVITSICLWEDSCLIYVICVFLCILVSGTYCVVFLCFVRLMSCVLNVASFFGFSILGCTFGFL